MSLEAGTVLGKYRVLRALGEGGMAQVFEAEHVRLGHKVAIKVLRDDYVQSASIVSRFDREGRALSKLKSPNIVRVVDVDTTPGGAPYLVMEHLEGQDLLTELERRGALPVAEAVDVVIQACNAMIEAHAAGLIHRDLKPANLFLTTVAGARVVRVLDFGIALESREGEGVGEGDARLTRAESVMGTPFYMAPEQFRSARDVDARADVWALGATLYELLAGVPPFVGTATTIGISVVNDPVRPIEQLRADVPVGLRAVLRKALEKKREDRYTTMRDFANALAPFAPGVMVVSRGSDPALPSLAELAHTQIGIGEPASGRVSARSLDAVSPLAAAATGTATAPAARRRSPWPFVLAAAAALGVGAFAFWPRARDDAARLVADPALGSAAPAAATVSSAVSTVSSATATPTAPAPARPALAGTIASGSSSGAARPRPPPASPSTKAAGSPAATAPRPSATQPPLFY